MGRVSDAGLMLGFAGLVGAILVGLVAEATISWAAKGDDDVEDGGDEPLMAKGSAGLDSGAPEDGPDQDAAAQDGDLLDWADAAEVDRSAERPGDDLATVARWGAAGDDVDDDGALLTDVIKGGDLDLIDDFNAETDDLVVVYDPQRHPDPALTLEPTPDGSGMTVMLDGVPLAQIPGATDLRPDQVHLRPSDPLAA
jgi:hypothetical protein